MKKYVSKQAIVFHFLCKNFSVYVLRSEKNYFRCPGLEFAWQSNSVVDNIEHYHNVYLVDTATVRQLGFTFIFSLLEWLEHFPVWFKGSTGSGFKGLASLTISDQIILTKIYKAEVANRQNSN